MNNSDINWRDISEDRSLFEKENWDREILVQTTTGSMHFSKARHVDYNYTDHGIDQTVARYAYID
jgi:hypothetical protein